MDSAGKYLNVRPIEWGQTEKVESMKKKNFI